MLQRFALTIWRASVDRFAYIEDFGKRTTGSGMGYLYALTTTLAFFTLLPVAVWLGILAPSSHAFADKQLAILDAWYPDDLVVTVSGGVLTTNAKGPVVLDVPAEWKSRSEPDAPAHFLTIDVAAGTEQFDSYDSYVLLTDDAAIVRDKDGGSLRVYSFKDIEDPVVVSQKQITETTDALRKITPSLPWLSFAAVIAMLILLPWILGGLMWVANLAYLLVAVLLLMIVSAIMRRGMTYGRLYRLSLFGVTNSLLLAFALGMLSLPIPGAPSLLFFVWMAAVLSVFPRNENASKAAPLPPAQTLKR